MYPLISPPLGLVEQGRGVGVGVGNVLRQEIDRPQGKHLEFFPVDRNSKTSIAGQSREELSPAQIRDKRPHIPHSQSQGDLPNYTCTERFLASQKGGGATP